MGFKIKVGIFIKICTVTILGPSVAKNRPGQPRRPVQTHKAPCWCWSVMLHFPGRAFNAIGRLGSLGLDRYHCTSNIGRFPFAYPGGFVESSSCGYSILCGPVESSSCGKKSGGCDCCGKEAIYAASAFFVFPRRQNINTARLPRMTTPAPTPTPTPIPIVFECDPLVVLLLDAVDVGVSDVVADDLVCVDADAVVAVVVGAIPAVAVISGSGKVNRLALESLQQSSAEQQYEVEFLPHRITHSPPVTLSLGANHVSTPESFTILI